MKSSKSIATTTTFAVAFCAIASIASGSMYDEPSCKLGLKRLNSGMPNNDHLVVDEAICDGPWKLGINEHHQFGLWRDEIGLYELFATGAHKVQVAESEEGTESYLTVYGKTDDDIVWEVGCVDQSPNTTAKLIVTNATHVVRFAEEERLWSYLEDGSDNLDSGRCIVINNSNTPSPDDTPTTSPVATSMPTEESTGSSDEAPTTSPVSTPTEEVIDESSRDEDTEFYDCEENNPCGVQKYIENNQFYFPSSDAAKYVQCGMSADMCFVRDCGPGTYWDQENEVCGWAGMNFYFSLLCSAGIDSMCEYNK